MAAPWATVVLAAANSACATSASMRVIWLNKPQGLTMPLSDEDIGRLIAATPDDYPRGHFHEIAQWRIEARFRSIIQSDLFKDPRSPKARSYTRNRLHEIYPFLAQRIIERYCNLPDSPIRHVIID